MTGIRYRGDLDPDRPQLAKLKPRIPEIRPEHLQELRKSISRGVTASFLTTAADSINWLNIQTTSGFEGYWYDSVTEGNYLEREFHARDSGRVFVQESQEVIAFPLRLIRPNRKRSLSSRYPRSLVPSPSMATDEDGRVTAIWTGDVSPENGGEKAGDSFVRHVIGDSWYSTLERTDSGTGFPPHVSIQYDEARGRTAELCRFRLAGRPPPALP